MAHDRRRRHRRPAGVGGVVLAEHRVGQGLRPVPGHDDRLRPARVLLLHPPGGVPAGADEVDEREGTGQRRDHDRSDVMSNDVLSTESTGPALVIPGVRKTRWGRLVDSQTAIDFVGRRKIGYTISGILLILTVISMFTRGLNLGIDFEGGVSWDVPAGPNFSVDDATQVLQDNGFSTQGARIQERTSANTDFIKAQIADQP